MCDTCLLSGKIKGAVHGRQAKDNKKVRLLLLLMALLVLLLVALLVVVLVLVLVLVLVVLRCCRCGFCWFYS